jgi:phosphoribosylamine---glycine ligase
LAATDRLHQIGPVILSAASALTVVLAAQGYPAAPRLGGRIEGATSSSDDALIFIAGARADDEMLSASGGRVLAVTGTGPSLQQARDRAYATLATVDYRDGYWRNDIGWRELERQQL